MRYPARDDIQGRQDSLGVTRDDGVLCGYDLPLPVSSKPCVCPDKAAFALPFACPDFASLNNRGVSEESHVGIVEMIG